MSLKLTELLSYFQAHPAMDSSFTLSVKSWVDSHKGFMSDKQRIAIDNIYAKLHVYHWVRSQVPPVVPPVVPPPTVVFPVVPPPTVQLSFRSPVPAVSILAKPLPSRLF